MSRTKCGDSWCQRFWNRHKLSKRIATTKMREIPADFEIKKANYLQVAVNIIREHNVPPYLVYGIDETNVLFVSRHNSTRAHYGARKVRLIGVGKDKAQITTTLGIKESGEVLPVQYIFGGKTNACHPKRVAITREQGYFTHSVSHWQTVSTFNEYIEKIILPDKSRTILAMGCSEMQWAILKLVLHFTHYDETILNKLFENHIVPLYVPAGCTDIMQECDTVLNKTFKAGVKNAFRDYLHGLFNTYRASHPAAEVTAWSPSLAMSVLKPEIVNFVQSGVAMISSVEFKETIINAFKNDGLFDLIRARAIEAGPIRVANETVQVLVQNMINEAAALNDDAFNFVLALPTDLLDEDVNGDIYEEEVDEDQLSQSDTNSDN